MIGRGQDPPVAATLAWMVGVISLPVRYIFNVMSDRFPSQLLLGICQAMLALWVVLLSVWR